MQKEIIVPIYDCLVNVQVSTIPGALRVLKNKYGIIETDPKPTWYGFFNDNPSPILDKRVYYVVINKIHKSKKDYWNTIAHELLHLTQAILENRDIDFKKGEFNEPYTYLHAYLLSENFDFFEKAYLKYNK